MPGKHRREFVPGYLSVRHRSASHSLLHVSDEHRFSNLSSLVHPLLFFSCSLIAMMHFRLFAFAVAHILPVLAEVSSGQGNCTCGFYDGLTKELFTDSIIVYFNETTNVPTEFVAEEYAQNYAKDWVRGQRQGHLRAQLITTRMPSIAKARGLKTSYSTTASLFNSWYSPQPTITLSTAQVFERQGATSSMAPSALYSEHRIQGPAALRLP